MGVPTSNPTPSVEIAVKDAAVTAVTVTSWIPNSFGSTRAVSRRFEMADVSARAPTEDRKIAMERWRSGRPLRPLCMPFSLTSERVFGAPLSAALLTYR
jgi:hypothetical protein